jgi:hypothetical protein
VGLAAGGAGGLEKGDGEKGTFAAAAGPRAHVGGKAAPQGAVGGLRAVLELGDCVGVFVAEGLEGLVVAADVAAQADAVAFLVAVAGAEVGDLEPDFDAVAEVSQLRWRVRAFGLKAREVGNIAAHGPILVTREETGG